MKRTLLAMALLLTSVFGVAGCGSDDDVQVESRVKNSKFDDLAMRADPTLRSDLDSDDMIDYDDEYEDDIAPRLDASFAPSKADCDRLLDLLDINDLDDLDVYDRIDLYEVLDRTTSGKDSGYLYEILELLNSLDRLDRIDLFEFLKIASLQDLIDVRDLLDSDMRDLLDLLVQCSAAFPEGPDSVTTATVPYVDEVPPCPEGREVENSEECLD